eukprot:15471986-Alexandrium_andersonii.AAC.1
MPTACMETLSAGCQSGFAKPLRTLQARVNFCWKEGSEAKSDLISSQVKAPNPWSAVIAQFSQPSPLAKRISRLFR